MFSKTNNTALIKQIDEKIKWIIENEAKFYFWVPLAAFVVGGIFAMIQSKLKKNHKISVMEACTICYGNPRSIIIQPCHHLVMCEKCAMNVEKCPFCRIPIEQKINLSSCVSI